jgi:hypothetical protein
VPQALDRAHALAGQSCPEDIWHIDSTRSPDRIVDRNANQAYYVTLIEADAAALAAHGEIRLQAGMPAEVYLQGEQRTALQYLVEPVTQVLRRAGREQ